MSESFLCTNCGVRVDVPESWTRPKVRCPDCGVIAELPDSVRAALARAKKKRAAARPPKPPSEVAPKSAVPVGTPPPNYASVYITRVAAEDDEENSDPYPTAGPPPPRCPECAARMEDDAVVCVRCGWDQAAGRRLVREFTPLVEHWDAGMPRSRRVILFLLAQLSAACGLIGAILLGQLTAFVSSWLVFTMLIAFLLGTYYQLDLTRDRQGRVELFRTWHVCFWRRSPTLIDLREYEGLSTYRDREAGIFEWIVFLGLLPSVIPPLIWWWVAIRQDTITLALTRDHGYAALILYRGWNQEQARDIAEKLRDAARLPIQVG